MNSDADVQRTLGRIEGKLDALAIQMTSHSAQDDVRFSSIEKELKGLQQSKWFNSGVAASISSAITVIILWIKGH